MKILISRTDSIGDVILTLPLCGWIKRKYPNYEVYFLCQELTREVIKRCPFVDHIHVWDGDMPDVDAIIHVFPRKEIAKAAKKAGLKIRIGTSHRFFHLFTCNKLVGFSRINSDLHEAQLNFKLLKGLGIDFIPDLDEMNHLIGWEKSSSKSIRFLSPTKSNLIFHIKSRGSAKEWSSKNYLKLAKNLDENKFNIILTGTDHEKKLIESEIPEIFDLPSIQDTTGQLTLSELINLIEQSDGLLACSTGPLHIASIAGTSCVGLYPKKKPMHAGRWSPIGTNSICLEESAESSDQFLKIDVSEVQDQISRWYA